MVRVKNVSRLDLLQGREILEFVGYWSRGVWIDLVEDKGIIMCVEGLFGFLGDS